MAEATKIEWTDATFNCWRGCSKVSAGCKFCYAETLSARNPLTLGVWGPSGTRVVASEAMWREPLKWDRLAREGRLPSGSLNPDGHRPRVFCASLADVFEGPDTLPAEVATRGDLRYARIRLFALIENTPHLDWLLLTKRPQHVAPILREVEADTRLFPERAGEWATLALRMLEEWNAGTPPANVWLGTSIEDQEAADARLPHLLRVPARVRFLSCEPLLGPVHLRGFGTHFDDTPRTDSGFWVIVGCESGPGRRPMAHGWAAGLVGQCAAAGVACFVKQVEVAGRVCGDEQQFPADLRVREFPGTQTEGRTG